MQPHRYPVDSGSDIAAAPYRWPVQAPNLWREMDRTREEYQLFEGVALPMAPFAILWAWMSGPWLIVWVLLVLASWCAAQSRRRHVVVHRLVFEASVTGRIQGELAGVLQDWQTRTGLPLLLGDQPADPSPTGTVAVTAPSPGADTTRSA